ncbi:TonB-dependent receptor plug domain-containing protein [Massilia cavernae]|nr:TonB-dependent receptor [Massilia cavernae]
MPPVLLTFRLPLVLAALAAPVAAQTPPTATPARPPAQKVDEQDIQKVEIRGSTETYNPRRDDTATKIVVKGDEITKYGDTNVMEILKRLPGVSVGPRGIQMRGLGSGYTQFLLNGERPPIGFSTDQIHPDEIERIEIMRAASAEYSTQSIAGTINIIMKTNVRFKPKGGAQRSVSVGAGASKGGVSPYVGVSMSEPLGRFAYAVNANASRNVFERESHNMDEGYDAAGQLIRLRGTKVESRNESSSISATPRLTWTLENGENLTLLSSLHANRSKNRMHWETESTLGTPYTYRTVDSSSPSERRSMRTDFNWLHKLGAGAKLDLKAGVTYNSFRGDSRRLALAANGAPVQDDLTANESGETGFSSIGKYSTPIFEGHSLGAGWDLGFTGRDEDRFESIGRNGAAPVISDEIYRSEASRVAVYAQDEWNVTPRWSVYAGARWEGIQTISSGNTFDTSRSRTRVLSPLFHTLYKLPGIRGDQLRGALTRTYKAPATQSLIPRGYRSLNNSATVPDNLGNPDLRPELAYGLDLSYEHYWAPNALLSASVTAREIDDYTRNGLVLMPDGRWAIMPVNNGKAHVRSIELEAKFPVKALNPDAPAIELRANVARNWSWVDSVPGPHNRLDSQTPVTANFGLDYRTGPYSMGSSYTFANGGLVRVSTDQTRYQNVKRDLEAYVGWSRNKFSLRLALQNILAQDTIQDVTYTNKAGTTHR